MDQHTFYLASDIDYIIDRFRTYISFLNKNWNNITGRPVVVVVLRSDLIDLDPIPKNVIQTLKKLKTGYTNGVRVQLGKLEDFINTSCVTSLDFVFREDDDEVDPEDKLVELLPSNSDFDQISNFLSQQNIDYRYQKRYRIKKLAQIRGAVKRSYSYSHHNSDASVAQNILNSNNIDDQDDQTDTIVLNHIRADEHTLSTSNRRDNLLRDKEVHDIIALLPHASSIQDQADILHYLRMNK
jgi:phosphorylase kinase alpha/beta subunit